MVRSVPLSSCLVVPQVESPKFHWAVELETQEHPAKASQSYKVFLRDVPSISQENRTIKLLMPVMSVGRSQVTSPATRRYEVCMSVLCARFVTDARPVVSLLTGSPCPSPNRDRLEWIFKGSMPSACSTTFTTCPAQLDRNTARKV